MSAIAAVNAGLLPSSSAQGNASTLFVSATGSDSATGSSTNPLRTIQAALDRAQPGTTIRVAAGVYRERLTTTRSGTAQAPISIVGPETGKDPKGRRRATLYGTGRVVNINHNHIHLSGFTIDGQESLAGTAYPTELTAIEAFKDKVQSKISDGRLVYVGSAEQTREVTGTVIDDMLLTGAGGECVRLRNNAHGNIVKNSVIQYCGMFAKGGGSGRAVYHNGEAVYIGTSPKSTDQPMAANDASSGNLVISNTLIPFGSECFNVKENAHNNLLEGNTCLGNTENAQFHGSNVELRGHNNIVRDNIIADSANWNVKIQNDGGKYDRGGNVVENNILTGAATAAIRIKSTAPLGRMCGNQITAPSVMDGEGAAVNPSAPCPGEPSSPTTPTSPTPSPKPSPIPSTPNGTSPVTPPSDTPAIPTPTKTPGPAVPSAPSAGRIVFEAESGTLTGDLVRRDDPLAAAGGYLLASGNRSRPNGTATYLIPVSVSGNYRISGRVIAPDGSSNSVFVRFDLGKTATWAMDSNPKAWSWVDGPAARLEAGVHQLVISGREAGTKIDQIVLTRRS